MTGDNPSLIKKRKELTYPTLWIGLSPRAIQARSSSNLNSGAQTPRIIPVNASANTLYQAETMSAERNGSLALATLNPVVAEGLEPATPAL